LNRKTVDKQTARAYNRRVSLEIKVLWSVKMFLKPN